MRPRWRWRGRSTVAALDHDKALLEELANEIGTGLITQVADLSDAQATKSAVTEALDALGGVDILVNNVGAGAVRNSRSSPTRTGSATFDLNFMSYVRITRHACRRCASRTPAIINNASDLARQPEAMPMDYSASKAAVLALHQGPGPIRRARPSGSTQSPPARSGPRSGPSPAASPRPWRQPTTTDGADGRGRARDEPAAAAPRAASARPRRSPGSSCSWPATRASFVTASVWGVDGGSIRSLI